MMKPQLFSISTVTKAFTYARDGLLTGIRTERAIAQEILLLIALSPIAWALPISSNLSFAIIGSMVLVVIVEFLNSAIEKTVDYISKEIHPTAKTIKDYGSAAVFIALIHSGAWWLKGIIACL